MSSGLFFSFSVLYPSSFSTAAATAAARFCMPGSVPTTTESSLANFHKWPLGSVLGHSVFALAPLLLLLMVWVCLFDNIEIPVFFFSFFSDRQWSVVAALSSPLFLGLALFTAPLSHTAGMKWRKQNEKETSAKSSMVAVFLFLWLFYFPSFERICGKTHLTSGREEDEGS